MATTAQAIETFAVKTGIAEEQIRRVARILQTAKDSQLKRLDLWPLGKQGGGKSAVHVQPHHLVSLAIALAIADPIVTAPGRVFTFRDLGADQDQDASKFGLAFDALVDFFSRPGGLTTRSTLRQHGAWVQLFPSTMPKAVFQHCDGTQVFSSSFSVRPEDDPLTPALNMRVRAIGITWNACIDFNVIEAMADLWADFRSSVQAFAEAPPLFGANPFDRKTSVT